MTSTKSLVTSAELAQTASQLSALPQTTTQILTILADPMFEVSELIKIISLDQVLTSSLLRVANSATYKSAQPVRSVGDAVVRLGSGTILALAMVSSVRTPAEVNLQPFGMTLDGFWRHSIGAVAAAEEIASHRIASFGPGFSTAALLHDFGKILLARHITFERLNDLAEFRTTHPGHSSIDGERMALGVDHAQAGAMVARYWNLPNDIVWAIEHHHDPVDWQQKLTNGVIIANHIAAELDGRNAFVLDYAENLADAMLALDVKDSVYELLVVSSRKRAENLRELFTVH